MIKNIKKNDSKDVIGNVYSTICEQIARVKLRPEREKLQRIRINMLGETCPNESSINKVKVKGNIYNNKVTICRRIQTSHLSLTDKVKRIYTIITVV